MAGLISVVCWAVVCRPCAAQLVEVGRTEFGALEPRNIVDLLVSEDGRHVAWLLASSGRRAGFLDGAPCGASYAETERNSLAISPDGSRMGFVATKGDRQIAVIDGRESQPYHRVVGICFSPDSKHVAFIGGEDDHEYLVFDWREIGPFGRVQPYCPQDGEPVYAVRFFGDSRAYVYLRSRRVLGEWRTRVVVDGELGPEYDQVQWPVLDSRPEGRRIAYLAQRGATWHAVTDGEEGPAYDAARGPRLSADGNHLAYIAKRDGKEFVVHDGREGPEYEEIGRDDDVVLSPDGRRVAYIARAEESEAAVVDGQEGLWCDGVSDIVFSPDSRRVAYQAHFGKVSFAVIDGEQQPDYAGVGGIIFSPDSRRVAYSAWGEDRCARVIVDGQDVGSYLHVGAPTFSPDSRHVVYKASPRVGFWRAIVDGLREGPDHPALISQPRFTDERTIEYLAVLDYQGEKVGHVRLSVGRPDEAKDEQ